jgi:hypothetical protein
VDGAWLMRDRQWLTIDYAKAVKQQSADAQRLLRLRDSQKV